MDPRGSFGHYGPVPIRGIGRSQAADLALTAPSPSDGEVRKTALPDNFDGIRFEIGRMGKYVQDAAEDPFVVDHTHGLCEWAWGESDGRSPDPALFCLEAIEAWCRRTFVYLNDPPNIEVIQTPRRMLKITRIPPSAIRAVIEPFYEAMAAVQDPSTVHAYEPPGVCWGDCDEGVCYMLGQCACLDLRSSENGNPMRLSFRFGGNDGTLHHVWASIKDGEKEIHSDLTEPSYGLGDFSRFENYEEVEIPL